MGYKIDLDRLICLVEARPSLWDKTSDSHRDYVIRSKAWKDISKVLNPEYNNFTRKDKNDYVKIVMKKWTNIRDAWKKSVAEDRKNLRPYIYHKQLKFLEKNLPDKKNESIDGDISSINRTDEDSDEASDSLASVYQKSARQIQEQEGEPNMIQFMDVKNISAEDAHISFIRGLLPSLSKLDDDETLEFQMGVIKLLQEIRSRARTENESFPYYNMPTSSYDAPDIKENI